MSSQQPHSRRGNPVVAIQAGIVFGAFFLLWLAVDVIPGADTMARMSAPLVSRIVNLREWGQAYLAASVIVAASFTVGEDLLIHHRQRRDSWWIACMALAAVANFVWVWLALVTAYIGQPFELIEQRSTEAWQIGATFVGAVLLTLVPQNIWMPALSIMLSQIEAPRRRTLLVPAALAGLAGLIILGGR